MILISSPLYELEVVIETGFRDGNRQLALLLRSESVAHHEMNNRLAKQQNTVPKSVGAYGVTKALSTVV